MATKLWAIIVITLATLLTSTGQLLYKVGSASLYDKPIYMNYPLIAGFIVYVTAGIIIIFAMKGGELSVLYPFIALSFVWVSLASTSFLGEEMHLAKWVGVVVIILGISFIGYGSVQKRVVSNAD